MARLRVAVAMLVVTLAWGALPDSRAAQISSSGSDASEAKACKLMPTPDLEASYGGKVAHPHGVDGDSSVCTVNIAGLAVKLESAPPDTPGVPTTIAQGLMGARLMLGEAKQSPGRNTRDFGKVGCLRMKITKGVDGSPLSKPLLTSSCFLVEGGYLNLSVASENPRQVKFDLVKALLEKAAARR